MTDYYVGPGGNDGNAGTSYATRRLTLNGIEDLPLVAGDRVWVAPGVYRETLTVDVSGSAGSVIEYRADVTGQNTDGVGGIVRITGSENDQTATRASAITAASGKHYRTFTGFYIDTTSGVGISITDCTDWVIQDCFLTAIAGASVNVAGASQLRTTIRRCVFDAVGTHAIVFTHTATVNDTASLIENCIIVGTGAGNGIRVVRVGGVTVKNCPIIGSQTGIAVATALAVGQTLVANNCIVTGCNTGLSATVAAEFPEDYNNVFGNATARSNVTAGANSVAHSPLFAPPILLAGIRYPWVFGALSQWSTLAAKAGTGEASDDLFGVTRPATSAKKSWGAVQFIPALRDTGTVRTGTASLRLSDAGRHQMFVPVTNVSTVFSVYVQWEADYAGTKPQMVIKQPGQSDTTVTATGSAGSWELLTTTLTPAASPPYVIVELVSSNTATSTNFDTFFDDFTVS